VARHFPLALMHLAIRLEALPMGRLFGAIAAVADRHQLFRQLSLHRDHLAEPSSSATLHQSHHAGADLGELRSSVLYLVDSVRHDMGGTH
jgi:hypothetical protein